MELSVNGGFVLKKYEEVSSYNSIPSPVQIETTGNIEHEVEGHKFNVQLLYEYTVYGKVVGTHSYLGTTTHNKVVPKDVGLVWGPMAQEKFNKRLRFVSTGQRYLMTIFKTDDTSWYYNMYAPAYISNNHLVPSSKEIRKLMNKIKKDDYVKIQGYLCNIRGPEINGTGYYHTESSTVRGDYNCETIYVTDIKWLKEK